MFRQRLTKWWLMRRWHYYNSRSKGWGRLLSLSSATPAWLVVIVSVLVGLVSSRLLIRLLDWWFLRGVD
jgi:uncharacterized membrane protein (DUF106 family)